MYDLYGARDLSVEHLHRLVSAALGITFRGLFSEVAGDYFFADDGTSEFMVESNLATDEEGTYHLEEDFPDYGPSSTPSPRTVMPSGKPWRP